MQRCGDEARHSAKKPSDAPLIVSWTGRKQPCKRLCGKYHSDANETSLVFRKEINRHRSPSKDRPGLGGGTGPGQVHREGGVLYEPDWAAGALHSNAAMTRTLNVLAVLLVSCRLSGAAWQWPQDSGADRNAKTLVIDGQPARGPARQRYDIYDPEADDFTIPNDYRPLRPGGVSNRPFPPSGAYAPGAGYGASGPGGFGGPGGPGYRPGGYNGLGAAGVTKCKCAYPANCPAPALQFVSDECFKSNRFLLCVLSDNGGRRKSQPKLSALCSSMHFPRITGRQPSPPP